ncbi:MAG: isocitrate/isopropylmalate dehydrogenase family protein [Phototrophicales bacterium]|nr:isocitrate/isopropylmalate dehydrogenase family protein [Phototrophicales bacterium]
MELCVIEGDGVGHDVMPSAVKVLKAVLPDVVIHTADAGFEYFQSHGTSLPQPTIDLVRRCRAVLFGATNSPSYSVDGYFSPIIELRRILQTYASVRPTRYLPVSTARHGVDLVVVRESTEDLYVGEESTDASGHTSKAQKVVTRGATERVTHLCYQLARKTDRSKVTIVHQANILPQSDGLFRRVALEIAMQYPDIHTDELLVDTAAYWMVKDPIRFDMILTSTLYGDILSDMAAAWGGGLGLVPALNLGEDAAIAEPVHGAAPDIAGKGIANPTACIMSMAMLLRHHWNMPEVAQRIDDAIRDTLEDGKYTVDIYTEGAINTVEFTDHVISHL